MRGRTRRLSTDADRLLLAAVILRFVSFLGFMIRSPDLDGRPGRIAFQLTVTLLLGACVWSGAKWAWWVVLVALGLDVVADATAGDWRVFFVVPDLALVGLWFVARRTHRVESA